MTICISVKLYQWLTNVNLLKVRKLRTKGGRCGPVKAL